MYDNFYNTNSSFKLIFISLKVLYSHESALGMWLSLLKHVVAEKRSRTAGIHILRIYSSSTYHKVGNENISFFKVS